MEDGNVLRYGHHMGRSNAMNVRKLLWQNAFFNFVAPELLLRAASRGDADLAGRYLIPL